MTATLPRSARLEAVRALAALAVFGAHAYAQVHGFVFDSFAQRAVLGGGLYGVYAFFALSGYLLYLPFVRGDVDLGRYARNRALRILPLYYVVLAVLLVVNGAGPGVALRFLTFTQNLDEGLVAKAVDGPMWSLVVELHFYLLLPFLALALRRLGSPWRAGAALVVLGLVAVVVDVADPNPRDVWTYNLPSTFQFFVPGMLVAIVQTQRPAWLTDGRWSTRADLWLVASVPVWALVFWDYDLAPVATAACFLLVGAAALPLRRGGVDRFLDWRPLALLGMVSYGFYLWHVPVLHWVRGVGDGGVASVAAAGLVASLALAVVTWHLVEAPAMRLRTRRVLPPGWAPWAAAAGAALVVRGAVAVATWPHALGADAADYDRLGRLLATTGSFGDTVLAAGGGPTAFRPPLYPAFLGGVYRATAGSAAAAAFAQVVLGALAVVLVGALAARLWDRCVGLVAAGIAAVYPPLVAASVAPMSESLFVPLAVGALLCGLEARRSPVAMRWAAAAGVLGGLGVLARPAGLVLVPVVALLCVPVGRRPVLAAAAAAVAVVVPWSVKASADLGTFVPVSTIDGFNLAGTYSASVEADPVAPAVWRPPIAVPEHAARFADPTLDEAALAAELRSAGTTYALDHPAYVAEVVGRSTLRLVDGEGPSLTRAVYRQDYSVAERWLADAAFWTWWAAAVAALVGVALGAWRRVPWPLLAAPVLLWAVTVPVLGHARLRAPIEPFVVVLAAYAAVALTRSRAEDAPEHDEVRATAERDPDLGRAGDLDEAEALAEAGGALVGAVEQGPAEAAAPPVLPHVDGALDGR